VCGTKKKLITGRYRPVPGTGTGAGRSDPIDPVTRWDNLSPDDQVDIISTRPEIQDAGGHATAAHLPDLADRLRPFPSWPKLLVALDRAGHKAALLQGLPAIRS
jgi:hypothetical protein